MNRCVALRCAAAAVVAVACVASARADEAKLLAEIRQQLSQGQVDQAEEQFTAAIEQHPDAAALRELHFPFFTYHFRAGRYLKAAEHSSQHIDFALAKDPTREYVPTLLSNHAVACQRGGKPELAIAKIEQAEAVLAKQPKSEQVATTLAEIRALRVTALAEAGRQEDSRKLLDQELKQAREALAEAVQAKQAESEQDASTLAEVNVLRVARLLEAAVSSAKDDEAKRAAADEHLEFLSKHAAGTGATSRIVNALQAASTRRIYDLARSDPDAAEAQLNRFKETLDGIRSEDPQTRAAVERARQMAGSLGTTIATAKRHAALVGERAFPIEGAEWVNGDPLKDSDLKGKVVLLDFWAVWCGPCIATFPHLKKWQDEYGERGLVIVGVTNYYQFGWDAEAKRPARSPGLGPEDERAAMVEFAKHHELKHRFAVMPSQSDLSERYGVRGIPHAVVIDREGVIRMIRVGSGDQNAHDLEEMIRKLL
jgi:thiol-disulfide isomerase/thioredoxin/tetratricopeptide (TPR) repeat protein